VTLKLESLLKHIGGAKVFGAERWKSFD